MNKQMNCDYAKAKWRHQKQSNNLGAWIIIMIIFMIGFAAMTISAVKADQPTQCSIVGAEFDNLMSPERAEYMALFEHGEFDEGDMQ